MAEVYPSNNELLNIQSDGQTGVEYIPTGTSPYYLHFRKLLYRLILASRRANELRVYDEGDLDIGVRAGAFWLGTQLIEYEGVNGVALADDKDDIYIYLDADGNLITNNYTGFPDMAETPHIRLAKVTTAGGDIVSITDCRGGHNFTIPYDAGGVNVVIEAHTVDDELASAESGSIHTNLGAGGTVMLTLPGSAPAGVVFTFTVQSAQVLQIDPGSAAIRDDSGQTAGKCKYANAIGASISLAADANGDWVTIAKNGVWSEEA